MLGALCEPWPVQWCELDGVSPAVTGMALEAASELLWEATGRQFGSCPVEIRPCRRSCTDSRFGLQWLDGVTSGGWGYPFPVLSNGLWYNIGCGCFGGCSCSSVSTIKMPDTVNEIMSVTIDGESIPASGYVLLDSYELIKVEGEWPLCQDWTVTGGPGTWVIEASFGNPVPTLGQLAVGILAAEFAKACTGGDCNLPQQVVSVVRQGVSFGIADTASLLEDGLTGLTIPDMFIRRYNPTLNVDRAHVIPLDTPRARVQNL